MVENQNTGIQKYLDSAVQVLDRFGIVKRNDEVSQLGELLQDAVHVDEAKVMAIARVVQYESTFNALVRDNLEEIEISNGYEAITNGFDSIREDSKTLVEQLKDGRIDWKEGLANSWMKYTRGTTHDRFEKIRKTYIEVSKRTKEQIDRENDIIDAYMDFRFAIKEAEITSKQLLELQEANLNKSRTSFSDAVKALDSHKGTESEKSRLQLSRDEAQRLFNKEDKTYQLIKDVSDNLTLGYNVGETLVAKLQQTHSLKERVYTQAVTFMTTNEHVFTTMDAVYTSQKGLHEQTQSLEAMKTGINKGLEDIASLGNELERAALKAGYGATINSESVQKLVDSIVSFQEESLVSIKNYREEATKNAQETSRIVDEGKKRASMALEKYLQTA